MDILKYLQSVIYYNNFIILNIVGVYKDINNFFYIRKSFKEIRELDDFKAMKFRFDWIGRPYTVINFSEDFFTQYEIDLQKNMLIAELAPIFKIFSNYEFFDILILEQKRILDVDKTPTNGVLVYFRQKFWFTSRLNIFLTTLTILILTYFYL